MSRMAWVLALRRARQHVCCGREQQGCAVQALWGVEGAGAHSCAAPAGAGLGLASALSASVLLVHDLPERREIGLANPYRACRSARP